jgi:acyl-CoA thioesterase-2
MLVDLLRVLDLEQTDVGFIGQNITQGAGAVVFGGQLLAQTVVAASRSVPDKEVLSLQCVFARGARLERPVDIAVERMSNGRAFGSVAVTISQGEKVCASSLVLLHQADSDLVRYESGPPEFKSAEELPARGHTDWWDIRYAADIDISNPDAIGPPALDVWSRFPNAPSGDRVISQALLAYASDGFLIATAMRPHKALGQSLAHITVSTTVLTQTLSFHEPFDASEWLLLAHESPYAGRGRSYGRANVFTAEGRLVASYVQDNMLRDFPEGQRPKEGQAAAH